MTFDASNLPRPVRVVETPDQSWPFRHRLFCRLYRLGAGMLTIERGVRLGQRPKSGETGRDDIGNP